MRGIDTYFIELQPVAVDEALEGEGEFVPSSGMDIAAVAEQAIQALAGPVNNGFKLANQQTTGLSQVRSEVMEDLIADIVEEVSEELSEENSLDDFFGQF